MPTIAAKPVAEAPPPSTRFWPEGWWRIMEFRIGIIPLPVFVLLAALTAGFVISGSLPNEINVWIAVLVKLTQAVSPKLQEGSFVVYKFFSTAVTYPLLFAIGVALTPWDKLVSAFNIPNLITIVATVGTIMATGFFVGRWMNMYPIETAIVNACHSGQGGTGDVAILTAANRMVLMPFAQIATRIGGAIMVTLALIAMARFG